MKNNAKNRNDSRFVVIKSTSLKRNLFDDFIGSGLVVISENRKSEQLGWRDIKTLSYFRWYMNLSVSWINHESEPSTSPGAESLEVLWRGNKDIEIRLALFWNLTLDNKTSLAVDKTWNMEHSGTSRNIPEHRTIMIIMGKNVQT